LAGSFNRRVIDKEWMGLERFGKLLLDPPQILGFIGIHLSAIIAPDHEALTKRRKRLHSIGQRKRDSMPEEKILPHVKPMIFAKNYPAIIGVFPH